jgi:hypothetical protein
MPTTLLFDINLDLRSECAGLSSISRALIERRHGAERSVRAQVVRRACRAAMSAAPAGPQGLIHPAYSDLEALPAHWGDAE